MDEDIAIIDKNTRNERIKNFILKNKKSIISFVVIIIIFFIVFFAYNEFRNNQRVEISDEYNSLIIEFSDKNKEETKNGLIKLINKKDPTYSTLSLYFIIDNSLIIEQTKINDLFDVIIYETSLENEIKNLVIYKKALFNADNISENELIEILNPIINSKSIWKSHALYLLAEYFYSKNEKQKSKEFFIQIMNLENANQDLKIEAQKKLNRDLSE
mgnify:FL=1|tara:strand:+ start:592 stop:1236 length:645 start_codon:yes stop_codon:yes gene_type:complete